MNKIIHGDAFDFLSKMGKNSVDVIITDPPYDFGWNEKLGRNDKYVLQTEFERVSRKAIIVFSPPENRWEIDYFWTEDGEKLGFQADQYMFWIKPISTKNTSKNYSRFVEMIFVYKMEGYTWNTERNWANYVNVFSDLVEGKSGHPFEKPRSLIRRLILNHSNEGDIIFDPFAGSGIVPIEAKKLNRKYIANEIDEDWFNYIKDKINE